MLFVLLGKAYSYPYRNAICVGLRPSPSLAVRQQMLFCTNIRTMFTFPQATASWIGVFQASICDES